MRPSNRSASRVLLALALLLLPGCGGGGDDDDSGGPAMCPEVCGQRADVRVFFLVDSSNSMEAVVSVQPLVKRADLAADFVAGVLTASAPELQPWSESLQSAGGWTFCDSTPMPDLAPASTFAAADVWVPPTPGNELTVRDEFNNWAALPDLCAQGNGGGGTLLYDAIQSTANSIAGYWLDGSLNLLVVLSDGVDCTEWDPELGCQGGSVATIDDAAASLGAVAQAGVLVELISVEGSELVLEYIAGAADPSGELVQARTTSISDLAGLIGTVQARTCLNYLPQIGGISTTPPSLQLVGAAPPSQNSVTLSAPDACDPDMDPSSLTFDWTLVGPGAPRWQSGPGLTEITEPFTDADIGTWTAELDVYDGVDLVSEQVTFEVEGSPPAFSIDAFGPAISEFLVDEAAHEATIEVTAGDQPLTITATDPNDPDGGPPLGFEWLLVSQPANGGFSPPENVAATTQSTSWELPLLESAITTSAGGKPIDDPWVLHITGTDNEGEELTWTVTVVVKNAPPIPRIDGQDSSQVLLQVEAGDSISFDGSGSDDPDGGSIVEHRWQVIQVPDAALPTFPIDVGPVEIPGSTLSIDGGSIVPGTWAFRLAVVDDEGDESVSYHSAVVEANGPVLASIEGPAAVVVGEALVLDGSTSWDTDSDCEGEGTQTQPHPGFNCHTVGNGPFKSLTPGIVSWSWTVVGAPAEATVPPLPASTAAVFGGSDGAPQLSIPATSQELVEGEWTFGLDVVDGEGEVDSALHTVQVLPTPTVPPLATIQPIPTRVTTDLSGTVQADVWLHDGGSVDLDNLLAPPPQTSGITSWAWVSTPPAGCAAAASAGPLTAAPASFQLFAAGQVLAPDCLGVHAVTLTVEDDEVPAQNGATVHGVEVGNCGTGVCVASLTAGELDPYLAPGLTEATIEVVLDAPLFDSPGVAGLTLSATVVDALQP